MSELIVMFDKQILKRLTVKKTSITFGRDSKSDIALLDRTISTNHARITVVRDDCFLEDLQSTNGTYVNQQQIDRHLLTDGDVIGLGKYQVVFRSDHGLAVQLKRLSIHPKLMDSSYTAWLQVLNGSKSGYIIPLTTNRLALGNQTTGQIVLEWTPQGQYIVREMGTMNNHRSRVLVAGDTLQVEKTSLRFCQKDHDASHLAPSN